MSDLSRLTHQNYTLVADVERDEYSSGEHWQQEFLERSCVCKRGLIRPVVMWRDWDVACPKANHLISAHFIPPNSHSLSIFLAAQPKS